MPLPLQVLVSKCAFLAGIGKMCLTKARGPLALQSQKQGKAWFCCSCAELLQILPEGTLAAQHYSAGSLLQCHHPAPSPLAPRDLTRPQPCLQKNALAVGQGTGINSLCVAVAQASSDCPQQPLVTSVLSLSCSSLLLTSPGSPQGSSPTCCPKPRSLYLQLL